jgi:hypothetical protein
MKFNTGKYICIGSKRQHDCLYVIFSADIYSPNIGVSSLGTGALFSQVKRPEREINHSLPFSAEVNNEWNYIYPLPVQAFMACIDINYTFTLNSTTK